MCHTPVDRNVCDLCDATQLAMYVWRSDNTMKSSYIIYCCFTWLVYIFDDCDVDTMTEPTISLSRYGEHVHRDNGICYVVPHNTIYRNVFTLRNFVSYQSSHWPTIIHWSVYPVCSWIGIEILGCTYFTTKWSIRPPWDQDFWFYVPINRSPSWGLCKL